MEGMMDSSSAVTLVVKTPNRSIDDLQINCALNWTVEKIKRHLSSVYPSKPESNKQRLIYSGQLLLDHQILQEFLREHQDGKLHTLHLVCPPSSSESSPSTSSTSTESSGMTPSSTNVPSTPTTSTATQPTNDGLRYRGHDTPLQPMFMPRPPMWSPGNVPQSFQPHAFSMPAQHQQHHQLWMQYMQQMYQQHQIAAANYQRTNPMFMMPNMQIPYWPYQRLPVPTNLVIPPPSPSPTQPIPQTPPPPAPQPAPPPPQAAQARNNQELRMNAQGGIADDDDEENVNNDWLDKIYTLCRVVILLSIVWFYSSTGRFLMMIASVLLIYLYQWGAFQWLFRNGVQQNQRVEVQLPPPEQDQQQPQQDQQDNAVEQGENNSEEDGERETTEPPQPAPPPPQPPGPSTLRVIVNFVSTFFTSLVPQNNEVFQGN